MLAVLSPAKSLDFETPPPHIGTESPALLAQSEQLVETARQLNSSDIQKLMGVSEKIAQLNVARFADFRTPFTPENAKPALFAFTGDVYTGLDAPSMSAADIEFAQSHLRILSGLYGLLRPMDLMQAYRLEMGLKFAHGDADNLYQFWGEKITEQLNQALAATADNTLLNLASNEYFKAVKPKALNGDIVNVDFKENRDGKWKIISFSAKKARGIMARYLIDHRVEQAEQVKAFDQEGYAFNDALSKLNHWVFTREQPS